MDYDRASRHVLVSRVLQRLHSPGAVVLDVGGAEGMSAEHLPGYRVITLDIDNRAQVDVVASALELPFAGGAVDAVIALDVLEHIPRPMREGVIREMARVSAGSVILAGPYATEGVAAAEERLRSLFESLFNQPHPWLQEHVEEGLPSLDEASALLAEMDYRTVAFGSNPLPLWDALQIANFISARVGGEEILEPVHLQLLEDFLATGDAIPPGYRHVLVATRETVGLDGLGVHSPQDPDLGRWLDIIYAGVGSVVDGAMQRLGRHDEQLSRSLQEATNAWRETADAVEAARHQAAERERDAAAAIDLARRGWEESVAAVETLTGRLREVEDDLARRSAFAETVEARLVGEPGLWRTGVAGPPVTGVSRAPDPEQADAAYQAWIMAHQPPQPPVSGPLFSILTPVFNPPAAFLEAAIRSVRRQSYPRWELILLDASDAPHVAPICRRFVSLDERIKVVGSENLGIALNTNRAAMAASGEWMVLLDHDDELAPHALAAVASAAIAHPEASYIYSDEDKIDGGGRRSDPFFKPDWSPDLLRMVNYVTHLSAIRRDLWESIGGERPGFEGAQDYDLALRATEVARGAVHVPDVLYHWRVHETSTAHDVRIKPSAHRSSRMALEDLARRSVPGAWVDFGAGPTSHRLRYPVRPETVSVIVPFRDRPQLTAACLEAIDRYRTDFPFEVLAVSNRSVEPATTAAIAEWKRRWDWLRVVDYDEPFNFQKMNNWAVHQTDGPLLLFLNNDIEPIHAGWLEAMVEHAQRPDIGAVGARLFYPDGLVQHAGVFVGIGGFADHPWAGLHPDDWTPAGPSYWVRNYLAVTAACLMIERSTFDEVGGFDERFVVGGGDVDLGLRLVAAGYRNLVTPFARLIHKESLTRGTHVAASDLAESLRSYAPYLDRGDPYSNPNLTREDTTCRIRVPAPGSLDPF